MKNKHLSLAGPPYKNREVKGYPVMTIIRGKVVMKDGKLLERQAKPIEFKI